MRVNALVSEEALSDDGTFPASQMACSAPEVKKEARGVENPTPVAVFLRIDDADRDWNAHREGRS